MARPRIVDQPRTASRLTGVTAQSRFAFFVVAKWRPSFRPDPGAYAAGSARFDTGPSTAATGGARLGRSPTSCMVDWLHELAERATLSGCAVSDGFTSTPLADPATKPLLMMPSEPSLVGRVLNARYAIQALIGAGGMGCVYRAHDQVLDRPVAVKMIFSHLSLQRGLAERFTREAKLLAAVSHPHVLSVFDYGTTEAGQLFLVMELLDGHNLYDLIQARLAEGASGLDVRDVHDLLLKLCAGLAAVHEKGIVHRDLKPQNVFVVRRDGELHPILLDFGIARNVDAGAPATGAFVGTVDYASPEQLREQPDVDARADLYCLGVLAYECLGGRRPFSGSQIVIAQAHLSTPPPPLPTELCPPELWSIVAQLLEKDRARRPQFARAVRDALRGIRDALHLPPSASMPASSGPASPPAPTPHPRTHVVGVSPLDEPAFIARERNDSAASQAAPHTTSASPGPSQALTPPAPARRNLVSFVVGAVALMATCLGLIATLQGSDREPMRRSSEPSDTLIKGPSSVVATPSASPSEPTASPSRPAGTATVAPAAVRAEPKVDAPAPRNPVVITPGDRPRTSVQSPRPADSEPAGPTGPTGENGTYL